MANSNPQVPDPSEGGDARAKKLSPERREEIARQAADARWQVKKAVFHGKLNIAGHEIVCAVLQDGRRVLSQQSFLRAIGRRGNPRESAANGEEGSFCKLPAFLDADNLKPFISEDLAASARPILFRMPTGGRFVGFEARLLPKVCEVYLAARRADDVLTVKQEPIARACEALVSALAQTGIVALVDEATGYQEIRDRKALQAILDQYLRQEFAAWAKTFPDEFYKQMFRLRGWQWKGMKINRPQCVASYTKDIVYMRLTAGLLEELEQRNPVTTSGRRKAALFQLLTDEIGHPALAQHLHAVIGLMKATPDKKWDRFTRMLDRAFPKRGHLFQLDFEDMGIVPEDE